MSGVLEGGGGGCKLDELIDPLKCAFYKTPTAENFHTLVCFLCQHECVKRIHEVFSCVVMSSNANKTLA